jgi:hypothetical protein
MIAKTSIAAAVLAGLIVQAPVPAGATPAVAEVATDQTGTLPTPALMSTIVTWLATNFELPASHSHPRVELASPAKLAAVRYRGLAPGPQQGIVVVGNQATPLSLGRDLLAVYDRASRTMYLREGWAGATPAEISVLVHEMVHHLQSEAGLAYPCPAASEKLAYEAQQKWLALSNLSLEREFEVDRFTIMVRASCMY